jgi:hypothetical protein
MKTTTPELDGASITLNGSFNPKIFQPQWFAQQGLLTQSEADAADIQIIHPQICQFQTERFHLQATPEQFTASTKPNTTSEPLRDLVTGVFFILEHTPITAMGINRQMHFQVESQETWHRIGDNLAPKKYWSPILIGRPGLESLSVSAIPEGETKFRLNVKVEPSRLTTNGVYFEINNHHVAPDSAGLSSCMAILRDTWEEKQNAAFDIAIHIIQQAGEQPSGNAD